ncbi:MAG: hypothetical protein ACD_43C00272G0012 [uncultured bacterium]|nr:MAG: hypothetical protein ACD_43C00272G0012 [uncultured bacterium]
MKTPTTTFTNFSRIITWTIILCLSLTAVTIFILAAQGDTTALGDPYYEDTILAPDRAFAPWALCLLTLALVLVVAVIDWWHHRK